MKLYYYTTAEYALDDFDNERIKISEIGDVNDPNEWTPIFSSVDEKVHVPISEARKFVVEYWGKRYGFVSLSRSWNIAPMWGNYADKYRGVVFELKVLNEKYMIPITYTETRPHCRPVSNEEEFRKIVGMKSAAWSYEEEVRYLYPRDAENSWHDKGVCFGPMKVISPSCAAQIQLARIICGPAIAREMINKIAKIRNEYARTETHGLFVPIVLTYFDQETYAIKEGQSV